MSQKYTKEFKETSVQLYKQDTWCVSFASELIKQGCS